MILVEITTPPAKKQIGRLTDRKAMERMGDGTDQNVENNKGRQIEDNSSATRALSLPYSLTGLLILVSDRQWKTYNLVTSRGGQQYSIVISQIP